MKKIAYGEEARNYMLKGIERLFKPVAATLGPKGKTVIISNLLDWGCYTKDGVTVANEIEDADPFVNACIKIFRQAANKTVKDAGDGTTTSTVLLYNLINEVNRRLKAGENIVDLKKQLETELNLCVQQIKKIASPIVDKAGKPNIDKIRQLALTSANGDERVASMIAEAYEKVGAGAQISVRETQKPTYLDTVSGMRLEHGFASPYFANVEGRLACSYKDALVFVTDKGIYKNTDIMKFLDYAHSSGLPLIIFCTDIAGEALGTLNSNIAEAGLKVCAISISLGVRGTRDILKDIAVFTGAKFCSTEVGYNLDNISDPEIPGYLGTIKKFESTDEFTIIAGGSGSQEAITARVAEIQEKITPDLSDYDKDMYLSRKSKLTGGFAIMYIGGKTPGEVKELKDRCDDAVLAVRSAIEEGYVPGCGKAYLLAGKKLSVGSILLPALVSITAQVCKNGNIENVGEIINEMAATPVRRGYNARTGKMEDLIKAGVIDSAKVSISALENAVSTALAFLNTECISAQFKD